MSQVILRDLYCEKCSLQFDKKYVYDLHLTLVHGQEIKVKKEPTTFKENFEDLEQSEKQSEHITHELDKSLQCDKCNTLFKSKPDLKSHIKSVHDRIKPFECNFCAAKFLKKTLMKRHIDSVHEGKKPFQCNTCGTTFKRNAYLKQHIASVHEGKKP